MDKENNYELIIIGGGIHGAAIAADAAGRGLSVFLCEQYDFASGTSSASSKLIHGGLRYLENYHFRLVYEALKEREHLIRMAPHLVHPMPFRIPLKPEMRDPWLLRTGLFLYDCFANSRHFPRATFTKDYLQYFDATVDDSRLVISTLLRAQEKGATLRSYTKCINAEEHSTGWKITLQDQDREYAIHGKILINATGPWINGVLNGIVQQESNLKAKLIKGSHIVVPRFDENMYANLLQHVDDRIIFMIPYCDHFTLIGTTDIIYTDPPEGAYISAQEIDYLCCVISEYFSPGILPSDIVYAWSGVRSLVDDPKALPSSNTREYKIDLCYSKEFNQPMINIFGGKLTTHRKMAEKAIKMLTPFFSRLPKAWTARSPLPGGDLPQKDFEQFKASIRQQYDWLPERLLDRLCKCYGTRLHLILKDARSLEDLGEHFGYDLYEKEVHYLRSEEWAVTADDILWRRTKLGLFFSEANIRKLEKYLQDPTDLAAAVA